jgi:hypothetical protein
MTFAIRLSGELPLWLVAPHVPQRLEDLRRPVRYAPGCYWIDLHGQSFLWIAANELPFSTSWFVPADAVRSGVG